MLFQEADKRETRAYFRDQRECVYYSDDDVEELIEYDKDGTLIREEPVIVFSYAAEER